MTLSRHFLASRRRHPFYAATAVAAALAAVTFALAPHLAIEIAAIAFSLTYLILTGLRIPHLSPQHLRTNAERDDEPAYVILIVTLLMVLAAVIALFNALNRSQNEASEIEVVAAFASVIGGWLAIHTMFAMHYAHAFWRRPQGPHAGDEPRGGLDFPGTPDPAGTDFLYFAFVIGMTAQTSDVAITSGAMRRLNLFHAITSYFFNTVLVAAAVNAVVALAGG